ncbi:MAG: CDP-2,3-bis-(O-geranylgeranyl)-sn-glycerol synthase [Candidatus Micrarchaeota archaeon]
MNWWLAAVVLVLPMYFANSSAMIFGGKTPLDLGYNAWDGRRFFGKGKTFKGTFFGIFFGTLSAVIISYLFPETTLEMTKNYVFLGFAVSVGAIVGDLAGSFAKRRMGFESGSEVLGLDQLNFLVGGIALGWIFFVPSIEQLVFLAVLTVLVHRLANWIAFKTKLKKVPW